VGISSRRARRTLFPQPSARLAPSISGVRRFETAPHSNFQDIFSKAAANSDDLFDGLVIRGEWGDFLALSNRTHQAFSLWFL